MLSTALLFLSNLPEAAGVVYPSNHKLYKFDYLSPSQAVKGITRPLTKRDNAIPLIVTNNCPDVLWPGIATQAGDAPETHGFELGPETSKHLTVGPTWAGRVWGRTNCTVGGDTATCQTGDCLGKLNCVFGVSGLPCSGPTSSFDTDAYDRVMRQLLWLSLILLVV